jgi:preprotein translocase subunit SecY|uniref:Protein translocase subunit SecY n=1 Tax=Thorea hispida TaxID=202687 RepID=A0A1C9CAR1_9FLOR|nr:preprotein translocase subunit SecY [Thorea hispida]AOM65468.1 preprotein translocase subunit SecY [Thorea hispida]ARX95837.1 preprotein translocase subunit SecY [Thorea hispida]UNJ79122.1 preprotein translocase subunit SecY [Thorea hispida]
MPNNLILFKKASLTLLILILARLGIFIPIPGIDHDAFYSSVSTNTFINFLNIFSGGGFSTICVFALGIVPYINASLVIQLLTKVIPYLEKIQKEDGEIGKQKIKQFTKYLTLLWAIIQSAIIALWIKPYVFYWNTTFIIDTILSLTTGSLVIMWFSELITDRGIGNGASLLIFQNIVSGIPNNIKESITKHSESTLDKLPLIFFLITIMLSITILIQEGIRKIIIVSARQLTKGQDLNPQSYLPLKLNQGGVMPIVFASASMVLPEYLQSISNHLYIKNFLYLFTQAGIVHNTLYGVLIIIFSYLYTSLILNTDDLCNNLKKMGASIPNIRPGENTKIYLNIIIKRLTLLGSIFLFLIALVPVVITNITDNNAFKGLGATSLIILVGVAIDTAKQIQTYIISEEYENIIQ